MGVAIASAFIPSPAHQLANPQTKLIVLVAEEGLWVDVASASAFTLAGLLAQAAGEDAVPSEHGRQPGEHAGPAMHAMPAKDAGHDETLCLASTSGSQTIDLSVVLPPHLRRLAAQRGQRGGRRRLGGTPALLHPGSGRRGGRGRRRVCAQPGAWLRLAWHVHAAPEMACGCACCRCDGGWAVVDIHPHPPAAADFPSRLTNAQVSIPSGSFACPAPHPAGAAGRQAAAAAELATG